MPSKSNQLVQRIQEIQKFLIARKEQHETYSVIALELGKLAGSLKTEKLTIQIYSRFPILAQTVHNLLGNSHKLPDLYQFKLANFPSQSQQVVPTAPAEIILQSVGTSKQQQTCYPLSTTQKVVIGRRPGCQIQIPDDYIKVSGHHAEIQPIAGNPSPGWQLCDLNSTNGTYINGQKLQGCQRLRSGDKITLAYASSNEKNLEFLFECQSNVTSEQEDSVYKQLIDCDVVCLVINSSQVMSTEEKQFLEKASKAQIAKLVIVADTSGINGQITQAVNSSFTEVKTWLQSQNSTLSLALVPLLLRPFYPNSQASALNSNSQPELEHFCECLETLAQGRENILIERVLTQLLSHLEKIERILETKELTIYKEIEKTEEELQSGIQSELKEKTRKAIKKATDEKDKFFRQVKIDLSQSKSDLLDNLRPSSIYHKIRVFIENLKPVVTNKGGNTYIQLYSESTTNAGGVTNAITHVCRSELFQWGTEEWRRICTSYAEGGLHQLIPRLYTTLNVIPSLHLPDSLRQPIENVDIEKSLKISVVDLSCETRYQATSLPSYLLKNLKSNLIAITGVVGFFATTATLAFQGIKDNSIRQGIAVLTIMLIPFVFVFMINDYTKDKALKLEDGGEKLKEELYSNAQSHAKSCVERIVQSFNMRLESEERRMREVIDTVNEQFNAYFVELEKGQVLVKSRLVEYKTRLNDLKKDKADIDKFKQI
ncbi:MAG TPA: FHA domain-containing protein [Coleofasciculaceae cyanobacterium]|jgi:hypothetical protein